MITRGETRTTAATSWNLENLRFDMMPTSTTLLPHDPMMRPSLFVTQGCEAKRNRLGDTLQALDRYVDVAAAGPLSRRQVAVPEGGHGAHVLLQQLFNLSDEQMEF
jgi:hypothetical protein